MVPISEELRRALELTIKDNEAVLAKHDPISSVGKPEFELVRRLNFANELFKSILNDQ